MKLGSLPLESKITFIKHVVDLEQFEISIICEPMAFKIRITLLWYYSIYEQTR